MHKYNIDWNMKWICRPDTSSIMTPIYDSISPRNLNKEDQPDSQIQETIADSQSKVEALPPAFTSLVSSCAADLEQGIPFVPRDGTSCSSDSA